MNASHSTNEITEFMGAGINMFWARLRLILARELSVKMSSVKGLKYVNAQEHKPYYFQQLWENKNWKKRKKDNKASEEYFFQQRCMKISTNSKMASRFLFAAYIVRLLDVMASRFSLAASHRTIIWFVLFIGLFQRPKIHFSSPNSPL